MGGTVSKAFLSYVHEDMDAAEKIQRHLQRNGIGVWRDKDELPGGSRWKTKIRNAIREGTYFLSLHSENRTKKKKSFAHDELAVAIEELRLRPTDEIWLIPIRIDDFIIDDRPLGGGEFYSDLQCEDLRNLETGIIGLLKNLGVADPVLAEEKKKSSKKGEFTAPRGSPFDAITALQELAKMPTGSVVPVDSVSAVFGVNTVRDLSELKMISSPSRGNWMLAEPIDDARLALAISISKIPAFQVAVSELKKDFCATGWQLGEKIAQYLGRDWSRASCQRNGQSYKKWAVVLYPNLRLPKPGEKSYLQMRSTARKSPPKGRSSYFTPDVVLEIGRLKRSGLNMGQIAKEIGVAPSAVSERKRKNPDKWDRL